MDEIVGFDAYVEAPAPVERPDWLVEGTPLWIQSEGTCVPAELRESEPGVWVVPACVADASFVFVELDADRLGFDAR